MLYLKEKRARRRAKTLTIAMRRRDEHLRRNHYNETTGFTEVDCVCELSNTMFSKRSAFACGCRKRLKGRPKVANGMCKIGAREHVFKFRQEARRYANDALMGRGFEEEVSRHWPMSRSKKGTKQYTIEKRRVGRDGTPDAWWQEMKRYRSAESRDEALIALQKGAYCYDIRWRQQGENADYRGPMYEWRAGPDPVVELEVGSERAVAA